MLNVILAGLFIFMARVVDVSLGTVRVLMIFKSQRLYAALFGFVEVIVYIIALNKVVTNLDDPINLFIYALGFAAGNYVGSLLEEKVAIGQVTVNIISSNNSNKLIQLLREQGYGVTVIDGSGHQGKKKILFVTIERKDLKSLFSILDKQEPESFVNVFDSRSTRGGYFVTQSGI